MSNLMILTRIKAKYVHFCHPSSWTKEMTSPCVHHCVIHPAFRCDPVSIHFFSTSTCNTSSSVSHRQTMEDSCAADETSHLAVIARPAGHVLLRLDVVRSAERLHFGLRHHRAHDLRLHRDERIPVVRDLLIGSQLQSAAKRVGVVHRWKTADTTKVFSGCNPRLGAND